MAVVRTRSGLYSAAYASDTSCLIMPPGYGVGQGTRHVILACHGHGGYSHQYAPSFGFGPGVHTPYLADRYGVAVFAVDHATINAWGDANAMRALDDAYSWLVNTFKMPTTKVALMGWSMGGLTALNWLSRNPDKVAGAWLWNPATDPRFWRDAAGAYTPAYATAGIAQAAWTAEMNTTFGPSTTASAAVTIPALGGAPVTVTLAAGGGRAFADGNTLGGAAVPQASFGGVAFTYTSKDDTHLYGCVSTTAASIAVTVGGAITSAWATQYPAYSPWERAARYSVANGFTMPVKLTQASDDTTVPPAQNLDAVNGFVARTANPNITLRTPTPTGNHTNVFANVPVAEVGAFYAALAW